MEGLNFGFFLINLFLLQKKYPRHSPLPFQRECEGNESSVLKCVKLIEVEGVEHRAMLINEAVFSHVIDLLCKHE